MQLILMIATGTRSIHGLRSFFLLFNPLNCSILFVFTIVEFPLQLLMMNYDHSDSKILPTPFKCRKKVYNLNTFATWLCKPLKFNSKIIWFYYLKYLRSTTLVSRDMGLENGGKDSISLNKNKKDLWLQICKISI